jgi:hypothetical protein
VALGSVLSLRFEALTHALIATLQVVCNKTHTQRRAEISKLAAFDAARSHVPWQLQSRVNGKTVLLAVDPT